MCMTLWWIILILRNISCIYSLNSFVHITDIHLDLKYKSNSAPQEQCHRGLGDSQKYGFEIHPKPTSKRLDFWFECDSPGEFVQEAIDFMAENFLNRIDFVIWTGDNVRHDCDMQAPRRPQEVIETNDVLFKRYLYKFANKVALIPSIGNNDVLYGDEAGLDLGPNKTYEALYNLWKSLIPIPSVYSFLVYGSFVVQPKKDLYVVSINTLLFYQRNSATDCTYSRSAGTKLLQWLALQLHSIEGAGGKAILAGHIPPLCDTYKLDCFKGFLKVLKRFQNTIIAQIFGHTHTDEFFVQTTQSASECATSQQKIHLAQSKNAHNEQEIGANVTEESALGLVLVSPALRTALNPAFRVFDYEEVESTVVTPKRGEVRNFRIKNFTQYIANLTSINAAKKVVFFKEYDAASSYGVKACNATEFLSLKKRLVTDSNLKDRYEKYKYASS